MRIVITQCHTAHEVKVHDAAGYENYSRSSNGTVCEQNQQRKHNFVKKSFSFLVFTVVVLLFMAYKCKIEIYVQKNCLMMLEVTHYCILHFLTFNIIPGKKTPK